MRLLSICELDRVSGGLMKSKRDGDPVTYSSDNNSTIVANDDSSMDLSDHDYAMVSDTNSASRDGSSVTVRPHPGGGATVEVETKDPNAYLSFTFDLQSFELNTVKLELKWAAPYGVPGSSSASLTFQFDRNASVQGSQYFGSGGQAFANGGTNQENNRLLLTFSIQFPR